MSHRARILPMMEIILIGIKQFDINYWLMLVLYLTPSTAHMKRNYIWRGMKRDFVGICEFGASSIILGVKKKIYKNSHSTTVLILKLF